MHSGAVSSDRRERFLPFDELRLSRREAARRLLARGFACSAKTESTSLTTFTDLALGAPLLKALADENYSAPTPIQAQAIPHVLEGKDLLGIAQTGTGKTAAFALPLLQKLSADKARLAPRATRALILVPTRELAQQVADSITTYAKYLRVRTTVVVGGVSIRGQIRRMATGTDVLVATPGRLLDLIDQKAVTISDIHTLILDEADQMLDLGFIHDLRRITKLVPAKRQTLFFSATMPKQIAELASAYLTDPVEVSVAPVATTAEKVDQRVIFLDKAAKTARLRDLLAERDVERAIVFTRTKHGADRVVRDLERSGLEAAAIHGNKSQGQRQRALGDFKNGSLRILVATDIAARGIDVDGISHVVNFDLPNVPETYVHRIGRTARAGAAGIAISLCIPEERPYLRDIERLTKRALDLMPGEDAASDPRGEPGFGREGGTNKKGRSGRGRARGGEARSFEGRGPRPERSERPDRGERREGGERRTRPEGEAGKPRFGRNGEKSGAQSWAGKGEGRGQGEGPNRARGGKPHRKGNGAHTNASRPRGSSEGPVQFGV